MSADDVIVETGVVTDTFRGGSFEVTLESGHTVLTHLSGKMRRGRIKVLVGDKVQVEISPYDPRRGRMVYRWLN